ncbi:MAG: ABC transporter permease [Propionibacteriaceae bacterium]
MATTVPAPPVAPKQSRTRERVTALIPLVVLAVLVVIMTISQPSFLSVTGQRTLWETAAPILLLALGQTFVILTGGIDLSVAVLASLASVLLGLWLAPLGGLGLVLMLITVTAVGALNGLIVVVAQIPSFIVTLGAMGLWAGVALVLSGASAMPLSENFGVIGWVTDLRIAGVTASIVMAVGAVVVTSVLTRLLPRGQVLHAIGLAERATQMSGVRTRAAKVLAFALSGLFSALAGMVLSASQFSGSPTLATSLLLPTIAAVVVGGTAITGGVGGAWRTLVGALVIVVLRVGMGIVGVDPAYEQIVYGLVILGAVSLTLDRSRLGVVK